LSVHPGHRRDEPSRDAHARRIQRTPWAACWRRSIA
jgi:hypothetical protein